ncbi:MAG: PIN domain-containing protein [Chloroflexota bacterium]
MTYLLDTDILSNLMRRLPSAPLLAKLALVAPDEQCTTSITLGELYYGAHRATERTEVLLQRLDEILLPNLAVLPFDDLAAREYGQLRASLERRGAPIGDADLRIASIALTRDLAVVTANVRHFARVEGLVVENWLEEQPDKP